MSDQGSVLPLVSGYLALILITIFGASTVISAHLLALRIQGIADAAVLYGHDQAQTSIIAATNKLEIAVEEFLREAMSARELEVTNFATKATQDESYVVLCAKWQDPFRRFQFLSLDLCREARAKSFRVF